MIKKLEQRIFLLIMVSLFSLLTIWFLFNNNVSSKSNSFPLIAISVSLTHIFPVPKSNFKSLYSKKMDLKY